MKSILKVSALGLTLAVLVGCASKPGDDYDALVKFRQGEATPAGSSTIYSEGGVPATLEGEWFGTTSKNAKVKREFLVELKRNYITSIDYGQADACFGRVKYQRTENGNEYTYLEQIDADPRGRCGLKNSYIKFVPNGDGMTYTRHNLQGKVIETGSLTRYQYSRSRR